MHTTDRDYADKPRDALEFLNACAIVFAVIITAAGLGLAGYAFTLVMFAL